MPARPIVLDANILIRFVLYEKVAALLAAHAASIDFLAPDTAPLLAAQHHGQQSHQCQCGDGLAAARLPDQARLSVWPRLSVKEMPLSASAGPR